MRVLELGLLTLVLIITFTGGCGSSNTAPVITGLEIDKKCITPSYNYEIKCAVSDADHNGLTYVWAATGGTFSGSGTTVIWRTPDAPGNYTVSVKVMGGRGGEATSQLLLVVRTNNLPVIRSILAEPVPIEQGKTANITCVAFDPDGDAISYHWTSTRGNISGDTANVSWVAPMVCGTYTITVTVTDSCGTETSGMLDITVTKDG